jgi:hypothetical protein
LAINSAWLLPKDISKLQRHEIESYINEPPKKSGDLLNGYRIALEPTKWEEERRNMIDAAGEQDEEEDGVDEVDELQSGEEDGKPRKNTKKRKRESEGGALTKGKAAKNAKAKNGDAPKKPRASTGKGKKNGKSKEMIESEDDAEGEGDDGPSKKASPPPAKKAKRDREDVDEGGYLFMSRLIRSLSDNIYKFSQIKCSKTLKLARFATGGIDYRRRSSVRRRNPKNRHVALYFYPRRFRYRRQP